MLLKAVRRITALEVPSMDTFLGTLLYSAVFYQRTGVLKADAVSCISNQLYLMLLSLRCRKVDTKNFPLPSCLWPGGRIAVIIAVPTLRIVVYRGQGDALLSRSI